MIEVQWFADTNRCMGGATLGSEGQPSFSQNTNGIMYSQDKYPKKLIN